MTSINALRLDSESGLLICDEARYWNPDWMIFYTPEKIRSVVRPAPHQAVVLFMGQTGTSSIGDEWIAETDREINRKYQSLIQSHGESAQNVVTLTELARMVFDIIVKIKHRHLDDFLVGKFGFTSTDVIRGFYRSNQAEIPIHDKEIVKRAIGYMSFDGSPDEVKGIFGNSQILAGYRPGEGFRMYYMTERWPVCEEINEIFIAQGSGRDTCDLSYARFADTRRLMERKGREAIPRAVGLVALLKGINMAMNLTAGVGGYPKIMYINGHEPDPEKWVTEIFDRRCRLAQEMVAAATANLIPESVVIHLIDDLIFNHRPFEEVNEVFFKESAHPDELFRFLRGYPLV